NDGVLEPDAGTTEEAAADRPARPFHELAPIEPGTAEMAAFLGREPVFYEDYHSIEAPAQPETELGAILAVPIGDRGLLTVGVSTAADIDASTIDLVEILARDAAVAIERVEREQAVEHLHAATRALMAAETKAEIARRTVDTTEEILGHPKAVVRLLSEGGDRLEPVARSDWIRENLPERPSFRVGEGSIGAVFERGEVMRFDRSELSDLDVEGATQTLLCLPLGDHGVLSIGEADESAFDDSDVQLAKVFASNVEAALDRVDHELELARRNERLDQFAEIVSHDLRNPLNVVAGRVDVADVEEPHRTSIETAIGRMRSIIDDVLALARQGRVVSDPEPTDVREVAEFAWGSVETAAATLTVETDRWIVADEERLQQLLENLIRNSVEHGPADVSIRIGDVDGGFYLEDDGPGIPADVRDSIFDAGYSTAEAGTGLGLAIVDEIAGAHGWTVAVEDGRDGGARFSITGVEPARPSADWD
ncbi:MAG TPA: GAF domain-containing sensor histidine kinase, partial [Halobacteriales archaeon]|nr:GAF domain-containing sensor histidine kinase [Halobacteriales archaeon]